MGPELPTIFNFLCQGCGFDFACETAPSLCPNCFGDNTLALFKGLTHTEIKSAEPVINPVPNPDPFKAYRCPDCGKAKAYIVAIPDNRGWACINIKCETGFKEGLIGLSPPPPTISKKEDPSD